MVLIENFDSKQNFWKVCPSLLSSKIFSSLYENDKSKEKIETSSVMWAVAFYQAYNSPWGVMEEAERRTLCLRDILDDPGGIIPAFLIDEFEKFQFDSERRYIAIWCKKVDELAKVLEQTHVTLDNSDMVVKQLLSCEKLLSQKDEVMKRIEKKSVISKNQGGGRNSMLEDDN